MAESKLETENRLNNYSADQIKTGNIPEYLNNLAARKKKAFKPDEIRKLAAIPNEQWISIIEEKRIPFCKQFPVSEMGHNFSVRFYSLELIGNALLGKEIKLL